MTHGRGKTSRRGAVYALVLGTVAIAVAMVLGGLELAQIASRRSSIEADVLSARALADSALEQGLARLLQDPQWRKSYDGVDIDIPIKASGNGTMTAQVSDPDGDLVGGSQDDAQLVGIGTCGQARQIAQLTIHPTPRAVTALSSAIHAQGTITISGSIVSDGSITSAATVQATGTTARVGAVVQAPDIKGAVYLRRTAVGDPGLTVPSYVDAPAYWASRGTAIALAAISGRKIEQQHFSSTNNPYGLADPNGIYVIDCKGASLNVCDTRIDGTLVLLNTGASTSFTKGVSIVPPDGQPALVVQGPITLNLTGSTFEVPVIGGGGLVGGLLGGLGGVGGVLSDTFSPGLEGAVFITGAAVLRGSTPIYGSLICQDTLTVADAPVVRHKPELLDNPPDGFWDALDARILPGSAQQVVE